MLIGTQTDFCVKSFGEEEGIGLIAKAGFDSLDFSFFIYPNREAPFTLPENEFTGYFNDVSGIIKSNNLIVGQTHTPFATYVDEPDEDEYRLQLQVRTIKATALLGSKYAVIHPAMVSKRKYGFYTQEIKEINIKRYTYLCDYLKEYDVYCCIENMFSCDSKLKKICPTTCTTAEEMVDYIDTLNEITKSDRFVACFDTGHSNLIHFDGYETVNPVDMIHILGDRLKVLHVHDNDGVFDDHTIPGFGNIDWEDVCTALKEIKYDGVFNLEADSFPFKCGKECALESEALMYSVAKKLVDTYSL